MDLPKRVAPQGSPGRYPREMAAPRAMEADENATPRRPVQARSASPQRKRVLGERNGGSGSLGQGAAPSPAEASAGAYDPKTNCTTPRPEFLRYDPKRSAEILLRLEREAATEEECSGLTSGTEILDAVCSGSSDRESDSECDDADEEEVLPARGGRWARAKAKPSSSPRCLAPDFTRQHAAAVVAGMPWRASLRLEKREFMEVASASPDRSRRVFFSVENAGLDGGFLALVASPPPPPTDSRPIRASPRPNSGGSLGCGGGHGKVKRWKGLRA